MAEPRNVPRFVGSTLFINESKVNDAIMFYEAVFGAVRVGEVVDPKKVPATGLKLFGGTKNLYIAVVAEGDPCFCVTHGGSEVLIGSSTGSGTVFCITRQDGSEGDVIGHKTGDAMGLMPLRSTDVEGTAVKATTNGATVRVMKKFGEDAASMVVVNDPFGFFWLIMPMPI